MPWPPWRAFVDRSRRREARPAVVPTAASSRVLRCAGGGHLSPPSVSDRPPTPQGGQDLLEKVGQILGGVHAPVRFVGCPWIALLPLAKIGGPARVRGASDAAVQAPADRRRVRFALEEEHRSAVPGSHR